MKHFTILFLTLLMFSISVNAFVYNPLTKSYSDEQGYSLKTSVFVNGALYDYSSISNNKVTTECDEKHSVCFGDVITFQNTAQVRNAINKIDYILLNATYPNNTKINGLTSYYKRGTYKTIYDHSTILNKNVFITSYEVNGSLMRFYINKTMALDLLTTNGNLTLDLDPTLTIIRVIDAKHLNASRVEISDIYESVKELDDVWSEDINASEFVRVTFEEAIIDGYDVTIYPKIISGNPKINVYEVNKSVLLASFETINEYAYNKRLLYGINGSQDTFDLEIVNGSVSFDHIIDPASGYLVTIISPANNTNYALNTPVEINATITNGTDLQFISYFWNGTQYVMLHTTNSLGFYNFDNISSIGDSSTKFVDITNKFNATSSGINAPTYTTGKYGTGILCDGVNDYLNTSQSFTSSVTDWYIEAWFKLDSNKVQMLYDSWLTSGAYVRISFTAGGIMSVVSRDSTSSTVTTSYSTALSTGTWYHVVGIRSDAANVQGLYVNGVAVNSSSDTRTGNFGGTAGTEKICSQGDATAAFFNGTIDELHIEKRVIPAPLVYEKYVSRVNLYAPSNYSLYVSQSNSSTTNLSAGTYTFEVMGQDATTNKSSGVYTVTVGATTNSCSYVSGNHTFQCSDNCNLTSNINFGGNNVWFNGTGTVTVDANLTNIKSMFLGVGCTIRQNLLYNILLSG